MAARQETTKPQEQQHKQPEQAKQPEEQTKSPTQPRPTESGMVPHRGGTPARHGGWEPLSRLRDEFDRAFDRFFSRGGPGMPAGRDGGWGLDVREEDDNVIVRAEAPGFEPTDFEIQVRGDQLVMCACRGAEEEEGGYRGWRRNEFYESVALPTGVDADKVKATYRHGVLTVTLPKTEDSKAKRIAVEG